MTAARMMVLLLVSGQCMAGGGAASRDSGAVPDRRGLLFTYGIGAHGSSSGGFARGGSAVEVMIGYCVSPSLFLRAGVLTGTDQVDSGGWRRLSLGGARLQADWFPLPWNVFRPDVFMSWDLITLLTHDPGRVASGFNGGGPRVGAGVSWEASKYIAATLQGSYAFPRFWNGVNEAPEGSLPFTQRWFSVEFTATFFPNLFP